MDYDIVSGDVSLVHSVTVLVEGNNFVVYRVWVDVNENSEAEAGLTDVDGRYAIVFRDASTGRKATVVFPFEADEDRCQAVPVFDEETVTVIIFNSGGDGVKILWDQ